MRKQSVKAIVKPSPPPLPPPHLCPLLIQLVVLQFAARGQLGLQFYLELDAVNDSAREDIRCYINGQPLEPSEITPQDFKPTPEDPGGIHSNKLGLSKVSLV